MKILKSKTNNQSGNNQTHRQNRSRPYRTQNNWRQAIFAVAIALILLAPMIAIPNTKAQTMSSTPTYAYVAVSPNPAGLNQTVTIEMWLAQPNPTEVYSTGGRWQNFTALVTEPDKTTETLGPFTANAASFAVTTITPDQIGNYTIFFNFPGQKVVGFSLYEGMVNTYYEGSNATTTLTVQQQPAASTPQAPLPANYWTRPINAQNSNWYTISGNWLGMTDFGAFGQGENNEITGDFQPYSQGPSTAHILWTKPLVFGGLIGGEFGGGDTSNYYTGKSYQTQFSPPVIINGVLYYNSPTAPYDGFYAVDLSTGQTLWYQNSTTQTGIATEDSGISMGQVYNYLTPNQEGGIPYLWSIYARNAFPNGIDEITSTWSLYDANTGNLILKVANAYDIAGTFVEGPNGELLDYMMGNNWVALWNSSQCIQAASTALTYNQWEFWTPNGATINFNAGIQWNVTVPNVPGQTISKVDSNVILATAGTSFLLTASVQTNIGYSATTGQQLWIQNVTLPSGPATSYDYQMGPMANGVFTAYDAYAKQWYGFSETTGKQVWGPTAADPSPWASEYSTGQAAYGILYGETAAGIDAYNITTGQFLWHFDGLNSGTDFPGFTYYPFVASLMTIADGMIYTQTGDSHGDPLFRGAQLYCVNATTGQLIWNINDFTNGIPMPISDGEMIVDNMYDNQLYAYGMGPSQTTASVQSFGSSVVISGSVTDISAGSQQTAIAANYPNGLPCVSDASMTQFMEAVYMQQPMPTNVTGVPVTISVTDSNHNTYVIGTTTTSASGTYGLTWTPDISGNFTVTATFGGTDAYYGSSATTYFYASAAAATPAPTASLPSGIASTGTVELGIAVVIVVVVICVAVLAVLMLRKRP